MKILLMRCANCGMYLNEMMLKIHLEECDKK